MRNVYLLIILFLVACVVCAEIYIYQIKGDGFFQASAISGSLWLIELLLMLLVACFIGWAIGWQLRQATITNLSTELQLREQDRRVLNEKLQLSEDELIAARKKLARAQQSFKDDFKQQNQEKQHLREVISSLEAQCEKTKEELATLRKIAEAQQKDFELNTENTEILKAKLESAQNEIEALKSKTSRPFTLPPKDDLKLIAGIGPALEKKLNGLGIYSFRQISELTPKTIDEITAAIKFFPGRIERDNWVSQARNFEQEKQRQVI